MNPDPAWAYAAIYQLLELNKSNVDSLIEWLSHIETATKQTDETLKLRLEEIEAVNGETLLILED